jgi:hypothetical protein
MDQRLDWCYNAVITVMDSKIGVVTVRLLITTPVTKIFVFVKTCCHTGLPLKGLQRVVTCYN